MLEINSIQPDSSASILASFSINDNEMQTANIDKSESLKVLIVDDEQEIIEEMAEKLEWQGFDCLTATSAEQGLELFLSNPAVAIVISDIKMPGMDGLSLCKSINNHAGVERDYALVIMTGHAGISEAISALKIRVSDFLTKPIMPELLVHSVKKAEKHINACVLERSFKQQLNAQVAAKTESLKLLTQKLEDSNSKLMHANQVKKEFMAMITHELKTPLHQIVGLADILDSEIVNPLHQDYLGNIKEAGWRLTGIVNGIFDMVSIANETFELNISEVCVDNIINQVVEVYQAQAVKSHVLIAAKNAKEYRVQVDELRLSQALGSLLSNAIKHAPADSYVQISTKVVDKQLEISVRDDGYGMSEKDQKKALQALSQVDGTETRDYSGIGSGLFLAKAIAEMHGGSLIIDSIIASGTLVTIKIPTS